MRLNWNFNVVAAENNFIIKQSDVSEAFSHGALQEEIHLKPLERIDVPEGKVFKLKKILHTVSNEAQNA